VSRRIAERRSSEGEDAFAFHLRSLLAGLEPVVVSGRGAALAQELTPLLRHPGESHRLWRWLLPGVPEALACFRELGLALVVVSNSDGTVERGLRDAGLRPFFSAVVDSALVGFEKPDPRIFEHALEISGREACRVLHVGDLFAADVAGARAAGIHALLLDPFGDWRQADCTRMTDLTALAAKLREVRETGPASSVFE
jgi:HAD superfamily hydrolase (TIGR01549 family)